MGLLGLLGSLDLLSLLNIGVRFEDRFDRGLRQKPMPPTPVFWSLTLIPNLQPSHFLTFLSAYLCGGLTFSELAITDDL
jgi:hypothetical protein